MYVYSTELCSLHSVRYCFVENNYELSSSELRPFLSPTTLLDYFVFFPVCFGGVGVFLGCFAALFYLCI